IIIEYEPRKLCLELKSLKMYLLAYRDLGIFYENAVNRMLRDFVAATKPAWFRVTGEFTPRGGLTTIVTAQWPRTKSNSAALRG
ncbi:MAG: NADPH-dependent 7-cyano-7-deazaguanine reductase QueF, partial [Candidatus Acidiferrales bacterium]